MNCTTGEIISVGTGRLCCSMDRIYELMNHLTGDNLFTHQLPRAFKACEAWVKEQHPWLSALDTDACNTDNWKEWLAEIEKKHGGPHELKPLPREQWAKKNPLQEAVEMFGEEKVIAVTQ